MRRLILGVVLLSGCAGPARVKTPCSIEGVKITVLDPKRTTDYCMALDVVDETGNWTPGDPIWGCARGKEIVIPAGDKGILAHEVAHLMEWYCKKNEAGKGR